MTSMNANEVEGCGSTPFVYKQIRGQDVEFSIQTNNSIAYGT
jgi:hypothetical protein